MVDTVSPTASPVNVSPRFSLEGWNLGAWLKGNKEVIKIALGAVVTLSAVYPQLAPYFVVGGAGTVIVKAILDIVDYYSSEVKLS